MSAEIIAIIIMSLTIIGIQMTTFIYLLRRLDTLQEEVSEVRKEIGKVAERVARLEGILIGRQQVENGTFTQQVGDD